MIGPTRLNYARIIPMVDYTAKVVSKVLARLSDLPAGACPDADHEGLIFAAQALISRAKSTAFAQRNRTMTDPTARADEAAPDAPETAAGQRRSADPVAVLAKEAADLKDRLLRTLAEMENLRRRTEQGGRRRAHLRRHQFRARHPGGRRQHGARPQGARRRDPRQGGRGREGAARRRRAHRARADQGDGEARRAAGSSRTGRSSTRTCIRRCSRCPTRRCRPARSCR